MGIQYLSNQSAASSFEFVKFRKEKRFDLIH